MQATDIILYALSALVTLLWYLLRQKDAAQEARIELLFRKHDEDVAALQELRLHIAEGHYKKGELDARFDKIEYAVKEGFNSIGYKFDKLADALNAHITREDNRP